MDVFDAELVEKKVNLEFMVFTQKLTSGESSAFDEFKTIIDRQKLSMKHLIELFQTRIIGVIKRTVSMMNQSQMSSSDLPQSPWLSSIESKTSSDTGSSTRTKSFLEEIGNLKTSNKVETTTTTTTPTTTTTTDSPTTTTAIIPNFLNEADENKEYSIGNYKLNSFIYQNRSKRFCNKF